jgi:hypothetical protein
MRGLGRLIGKAAAGAAPIALEKWRQDVLAQRDAKLREYDVQDRDVQISNTNEQARLNRDQDASQFNQTVEQRKTEFSATSALDERRTTAAERTATAEQGRIGKLMTQLDIAIDSDKIALEDAKALQSLKQELTKAETPEEQDRILTVIMGQEGKERDSQYKFSEGTSIDPVTFERISTLVRTNNRTGEFEVVLGPGGAGGASSGGAQDEYELMPRADAEAWLKSNDTPENRKIFEETYGASDKAAAPTAPAASNGPGLLARQAASLPPGGGATLDNQAPDPLAGFEQPTRSKDVLTELGGAIGNKATEIRESAQNAASREALRSTVAALNSKKMSALASVGKERLTTALNSGKLSDAQAAQVKAFLAKK